MKTKKPARESGYPNARVDTRGFGITMFRRKPIVDDSAQMTVELCVVFPVALILALIVVNAMTFFGDCAAFDRAARNSVRTNAAALAHGQAVSDSVATITSDLQASFTRDNLEVLVEAASGWDGLATFQMTLEYSPTLFGMGMRTEVLGVPMPKLSHTTSLKVRPYRPGILF